MTDLDNAIRLFFEAGQLKRTHSSGWQLAGVPNPESVAEHSFRVGVIAYVIAAYAGGNPDRAATLGLFHDFPEARIGDVPSVGKAYVTTANPRAVIADQVAGLPPALAEHMIVLIDEHENAKNDGATLEARCSRDADKLECLVQAREYEAGCLGWPRAPRQAHARTAHKPQPDNEKPPPWPGRREDDPSDDRSRREPENGQHTGSPGGPCPVQRHRRAETGCASAAAAAAAG